MKRIVLGVCVAVLVFSVAAQAQVAGQPGPEHKKLEVWAGTWTLEGEGRDSPSGPTYKFDWTMQGNWLPGGFFLEIRGSIKYANGEEDRWLEVLGYDPVKKTHVGYVFGYSGDFETYAFTFKDGTLFEKGEGWRHEWHFSLDWMSVSGKSEHETDGKWWTSFEAKGVRSPAKKEAPEKSKAEEGSVEQELIRLEKEWGNALVNRDVAFLDGIFADDYIGTDSDGNVLTKAQEIASAKSGDYAVVSTVLDDIKVHVYGDTAVYFGRSTDKAQFKGKDVSGQYRWTDTWVKIAGRWKCVASHGSKIAQK